MNEAPTKGDTMSTQYRIIEETKGEVTMTENYSELVDAANSMLVNCGGEEGMPGDTVEELVDHVERHGGLTIHPFPGCVWRLLVIESDGQTVPTKATATIQADALTVGDLLLCGIKFREVLAVAPRAEGVDGATTELYVTVGSKHRRSRRLTLTADLTLVIRDRNR